MLGRFAIIDGGNGNTQRRGGLAHIFILTVEVAHDHAASMDIDQAGPQRRGVIWTIKPERQVSAGT